MKTFRVYVYNLSRKAEKSDLLRLFKKFGTIVDMRLRSDYALLVSIFLSYISHFEQSLTQEFDKAEDAYNAVMKMDELPNKISPRGSQAHRRDQKSQESLLFVLLLSIKVQVIVF